MTGLAWWTLEQLPVAQGGTRHQCGEQRQCVEMFRQEPVPPPPPPLLRPQHELAAWTELFQNLSVSNRNFFLLM